VVELLYKGRAAMSKRPRRNHATAFKAKVALEALKFYNEKRWYQNFDRKTPDMVYFTTQPQGQAAVGQQTRSALPLINPCLLS
jgi:hypothetical protein